MKSASHAVNDAGETHTGHRATRAPPRGGGAAARIPCACRELTRGSSERPPGWHRDTRCRCDDLELHRCRIRPAPRARIGRQSAAASRAVILLGSADLHSHSRRPRERRPPRYHRRTISLLWTLESSAHLVSRSGNPSETLTNIVNLIQRRFATDVCSVYLLEPDRANLVLAATIGLRAESVGRVRMRLTEGLAGLVAEQVRPVVVHDTNTHPRFKYFQDAGEDPFRTFLGVPVMDRGVLQGVLVVQTAEARAFGDDDVRVAGRRRRAAGADRQRGARRGTVRRAGAPASGGDRAQSLVELGRREREPVPRPRSGALARVRPQSDRAAAADPDRSAGAARVAPCAPRPHQPGVPAAAGVPRPRSTPGAAATPACSARGRWRTSPPSSACTSRCRSIRAASASSPATT